MPLIQKLALVYAALFLAVIGVGHVPALRDANGYLFDLPGPQWYGDLLLAFSGIWALIAAFVSQRQSTLYFQLFGPVLLFGGVLGLVTGSGCLDGGIFIDGFRPFTDVEFPARFFANLPHLAIGGFAIFAGFWLSGRMTRKLAPA